MISFSKRIVIIGYGAVAECTLPILLRNLDVAPANVTVIEFAVRQPQLAPWLARGVRLVRERITPDNMTRLLGEHLSAGDILIDLAWNIETAELLQWCHDHGVLYTNASVELWDPYTGPATPPPQRTLYWRHMKLRQMTTAWSGRGPTAVIEHGANPGLISHFTKQGLIDVGRRLINDGNAVDGTAEAIETAISAQRFNELAARLNVRVIHCSERDTQVSNVPKRVNEFVNTWSVEGFREEGTTTAELGWGTHEKWLPSYAYQHEDGPRNQICLARMGMNTWVRSWVPDCTIAGMVIRHGEAFTISDHLTVWRDGQPVYRPTVHYAYCPSDSAIASLHELRGYNFRLVDRHRILNDEICAGSDALGALIMGHHYNAWWTGSDLSIEESRRLVPHQNATTMQVAIAVVAGVAWMIENPERGFCVPDDLPHNFILDMARPYLGRFISKPVDWTPLRDLDHTFDAYRTPLLDPDDPWQFRNFLLHDAG